MKSLFTKLVLLLLLALSSACYAQEEKASNKWFIVLPLRFTHLQNHTTMLGGIKLGRILHPKLHTSISVYHSFYLKSFKSEAGLSGFDPQPRLFINGVGGEVEYYFMKKKKFSTSLQFLLGWGFLKYDLDDENFKSKQVNYLALEPTVQVEYKLNSTSYLGIGLGYRPLLSNQQIAYTSNIRNGEIPVNKNFPNGLNITLGIKGLF